MMLCFWGHTGEKWETTDKGWINRPPYDPLSGNPNPPQPARIGFWEKQRRVCRLCGKVQLRVAKS